MSNLKNLSYRIKSYFIGKSGIVEKVECVSKITNSYYKDDLGNFPQKVTFTNPLRKSLTQTSYSLKKIGRCKFKYKTYKSRDKFP
mgnify:FL=1